MQTLHIICSVLKLIKWYMNNRFCPMKVVCMIVYVANWPKLANVNFVDPFCYLRFVSVVLSCLFIATLWSPAGKGLTSWLSNMCCFLVFLSLFVVMYSWIYQTRCEKVIQFSGQSLAFYLFSSTRLTNSTRHEDSCSILYVIARETTNAVARLK